MPPLVVNAAMLSCTMGLGPPMPCVTVPAGPWTPGSAKVVLAGVPVLTAGSTCQCAWTGTITIGMPGQATVDANG